MIALLEDFDNLDTTMINRDRLRYLKDKYNFTMEDVIKYSFKKNEFLTKKSQISKLVNKTPDSPRNFDVLELSTLLAKFINDKKYNSEAYYAPGYFLASDVEIKVVAQLYEGTLNAIPTANQYTVNCRSYYLGHVCFVHKGGATDGKYIIYNPTKIVEPNAHYRLAVGEEKKTQRLIYGMTIPKDNNKFEVWGYDVVQNKKTNQLQDNIDFKWLQRSSASGYLKKVKKS